MIRFVLENRLFLRFWISTWASELSDWVRNMAMIYMVLELSDGSAVAFSMMMFSEFVPIFLFGFLAGAFVDRWDKRRTVMGAVAFRSLMILFLIGAIMLRSLPMLYIGAFVSAVGTLFFRGATPAFTMQIVSEEDRKTAANLRQISYSTMLLLGSPIGTLLFMQLGAAGTMGIAAALFAVAGLLVYSIRVAPETDDQQAKLESGTMGGIIRDIREGFHYAWQHPILKVLLFSNIFLGYGAGLINVMEIFIITEFLGLPKETMAVLLSVQGVGMLAGSFLVSKLKLATDQLISYGMVIMGIGLGGMALVPIFYVSAGSLIVFSLGQIAFMVGMATLMQTKVDFDYQGRSTMSVQTIFNGFMVLAMLTSGWLHEAFTVQPVVIGGGLMIVMGGVICFLMFARVFRLPSQSRMHVQEQKL